MSWLAGFEERTQGRSAWRYGQALLLIVLAFAIRLPLTPWLGSKAALVGGTTTLIEMCCPSRAKGRSSWWPSPLAMSSV